MRKSNTINKGVNREVKWRIETHMCSGGVYARAFGAAIKQGGISRSQHPLLRCPRSYQTLLYFLEMPPWSNKSSAPSLFSTLAGRNEQINQNRLVDTS